MRSLKIFVVDDDRDAAEGLAEVLQMFGHQVQTAFNGKDAIEIFREQEFDVSLMDVMMPGMNGVESFLEIRKIQPDAKVYMMTGYSVQQLLTQAIENGALGVWHKPVDMDQLLASLEEIQPDGMVLLADDDPAFCENIEQILRQHDYSVCVAKTGQEALDKVLNENIDVLVLDLQLPVLNGFEVYLQLKKQGRAVPTIVVTGHAEEESQAIDMLRDMTSTGVLVKPFDPSKLIQALEVISKEAAAQPSGPAPQAQPLSNNGAESAPEPAPKSPAPAEDDPWSMVDSMPRPALPAVNGAEQEAWPSPTPDKSGAARNPSLDP